MAFANKLAVNAATTGETVEQKLARLEAENASLKAQAVKSNTVKFKIGEKGGISVYGLGRFPVTLYVEQWERLDAAMPELKEFIIANHSMLKLKGMTVKPS